MSTFIISNNMRQALRLTDKNLLFFGGPDNRNIKEYDGIEFLHFFLSLNGENIFQPIEKNNHLFMMTGTLYNTDIHGAIDYYFSLNETDFLKKLDGEFLFIVYNINTGIIDFFYDPWLTKPTQYYIDENLFVFSNALNVCIPGVNSFLPNKKYTFDSYSKSINIVNDLYNHHWNLDQYKDSNDDIKESFDRAVIKRWTPNCTLWLSGGLDSTSIALCLNENKKPFNTISANRGLEDSKVIDKTLQIISKNNINHIDIDADKNVGLYELRNKICEAQKNILKSRVTLAGIGAESITNTYSYNIPKYPWQKYQKVNDFEHGVGWIWPEDLREIFPLKRFFSTRTQHFHARKSLYHSQEFRCIFKDKGYAQEWINTTAKYKNSNYKFMQKEYLKTYGVPEPKHELGLRNLGINTLRPL